MLDALPLFESVAKARAIDILTASDENVALLCKMTLSSVETLLVVDLDIIPDKNVFDTKDALNRVLKVYRVLINKGVEVKIADDINKIMPMLKEAVVQINAAARILKETTDDKSARRESIPLSSRAILNCYDQVEKINLILK